MKVGAQRIAATDRAGISRKDQERSLKGVLRVVNIAKDFAADAINHRPMTLQQRGERQFGSLTVPGLEPVQEFAIGQTGDRTGVEQGLKALLRGAGAAA